MPSIKTDPPTGYFDTGTELGEAAFGYWLWVTIGLAMLAHHVRGQCSLAAAHDEGGPRSSACTLCGCVPVGRVCPTACHDSAGDRVVLGLPGAALALGGGGGIPCGFVCLQPCGACGWGPRSANGCRGVTCPCLPGAGGGGGERGTGCRPCLLPAQSEMPRATARPAPVQVCRTFRSVLCCPWKTLSQELVAAPVSWLFGPANALLHVFLLTHELLFALSLASYAQVRQKDHRNHAQTMLGLGVSFGATVAGHCLLVRAQCLAAAIAVPPKEAVILARSRDSARVGGSRSFPGPLSRPFAGGPAEAAAPAHDATGLGEGVSALWGRYASAVRSWRAKEEGRAVATISPARPAAEYGASQSVNAYEQEEPSGALPGPDGRPYAEVLLHPRDVHSDLALGSAMRDDLLSPVDGRVARRAGQAVARSKPWCCCCCHRDAISDWGHFGGADASSVVESGYLAPLILEAATAHRGVAAAAGAASRVNPQAMGGADCTRLWLCSRPTASATVTVHGAAHSLLVVVCIVWYAVWFFGTLVLVGLDTHPWGTWSGASG